MQTAAATQYTGKRASTVYSITGEGRRVLAAWLAEPGAPPRIGHEALLKVAFADHGTLEGLRANLAAIRAEATAELEYFEAREREYAESGGPFSDRLPVIALVSRYCSERDRALLRWAEWAEDSVARWTGVTPDTSATVPGDAFDDRGQSADPTG